MPTGVNLNQYAGPGSLIRWHSDNEPLLGPQNSTKLIVSLILGNSVEFMVRRRASRNVPSSIRLDHGDVPWSWMAWPNRTMFIARRLGCRVLGLTLPTAGLPNTLLRPVPPAGAVGVVCSQRVRKVLVEPGSRWLGWSSFWGLVLLLLILVSVLLVSAWIHTRRGASSQWSASILLGGALPLSGSCPLGWGTALATVTTSTFSWKSVFFISLVFSFWWNKLDSFFRVRFLLFLYCWVC